MRSRAALAVAAGAALVLAGALAGCGGGGDATSTPTAAVPAATTLREGPRTQPIEGVTTAGGRVVEPGPFAPGGLTAIVATLARQLGHPPRFRSIGAYREYAIFSVQDPRAARNLDRYVWRDGVIDGPDPEPSRPALELRRTTFTAEQVNLRAVPRLVARGDALRFEGSQTEGIIIQSGLPFRAGVRFLVNVGGVRESRQMRADSRGRVYEII